MAVADPNDAQLVLVSAIDADGPHLWIAATPRGVALKAALRIVEPGSSARLLPQRLSLTELAELNLRLRDVRDLGVAPPMPETAEDVAT
jgi:hypothetical protein